MTTRRAFLKTGTALLAILVWPTGWLAAKSKKLAFSLTKVKKLGEVDGWAILKIKGRHILFVRDTEKTIRALDSVCTHKQCTVEYKPDQKKIVCPCHGSQYSLDGRVSLPPAERSLQSFPVELDGDKVIITIEDES
jgi:Rieske Fe-S protein